VEDTLRNLLVTFGVTKRDADACIEYLKPYGYDNLIKLHEALSDLGLSLSRRRLIIESWSNLRNIRIPPQLLSTLRIKGYGADYMEYEDYYNYGYRPPRRPRYEDEINVANPVLAEAIRSNTKITEKLLEAQLAPPPSNSNEIITMLQQQNQQLQNEIARLREELRQKELEALRKELEALKEELKNQRVVGSTQYDIQRQLLENIKDFRKDVMDWLKGMSRVPKPMEEAPEYRGAERATPTEEELRELGIPEEFIEEE